MRKTVRVFIAHLASVRILYNHSDSWCQNVSVFYNFNCIVLLVTALLHAHLNIFRLSYRFLITNANAKHTLSALREMQHSSLTFTHLCADLSQLTSL